MTDRVLTDEDIYIALAKGDERAQKIITMPAEDASLKKQFDQAVWAAAHCLENFDKNNYTNPKREQVKPSYQKKMLLSAFTAVQCVEVFQNKLNRAVPSLLLEGKSSDLQIALLKAVTVYKTNGDDDSASLCVQRSIAKYRQGDVVVPSITPDKSPTYRAS